MNDASLSIIVPTFNNAATITATLDSLSGQSVFPRCQVFVRDDASTDETRTIVAMFAEHHANVHFEAGETNLGVMENYRSLLRKVDTKYVAMLEGDDLWHDPQRLELLIEFMERGNIAACFSAYLLISSEYPNGRVPDFVQDQRFRILVPEDLLRQNQPASFSNCIYRTEVVSNAFATAVQNGVIGYDLAINAIVANLHGLHFFPRVLSSYRISVSGAWSALSRDEKRAAWETTLNSLSNVLPWRLARHAQTA